MSTAREAVRLVLLRLAGPPLSVACNVASRIGYAVPHGAARTGPRILLVRPDHLGDTLLASPAVAALHDALPHATIDWLVGPWSAEMARRTSSHATITTLEYPGFSRRPKRSPLEPYAAISREARTLATRGYDAALILRPDHWWGAMLTAAAGIPRRFGYSVAACQPFLTDTLPPSSGHVVRANQELARLAALRLGGDPATLVEVRDPSFAISSEEREWASAWIAAEFCQKTDGAGSERGSVDRPNAPLVAVHPGSGAALKNWLPDRWATVVTTLRQQAKARVYLTGGPAERDLVESIAAHLDPRPPTVIGQTSLGQLAALFAASDLAIGCDSGPLHLAAAVGPATLRLYGPTDTLEFGPWTPRGQEGRHLALAASLPCQPCRAIVLPPCGAVERPACLREIAADTVAATALRLLRSGQARTSGTRDADAQIATGSGPDPC